jgi:hypothetical protein
MPARRIPGLLVFVGLAFFTAVLYLAKAVLMPVALAILLAFLLYPVVRLVEHLLPRALAVTLVVVLAFSAIGFAGYMLSTQASGLAADLPKYRHNIRQRIQDIRGASRGGAIENIQDTARDVMAEIDRERSVVQQEIRRTQDQPSAWVGELLGQAVFGDQPLGWPTAGNEETVGALQRAGFGTLRWARTIEEDTVPEYQRYIDAVQELKDAIPYTSVPEKNYYLTRVVQLSLWMAGLEHPAVEALGRPRPTLR